VSAYHPRTVWTDAGQTGRATGKMGLYSGHGNANTSPMEGTALILEGWGQKALTAWDALSARVIQAVYKTLNTKPNVSLI
jgi:hypothetical protein